MSEYNEERLIAYDKMKKSEELLHLYLASNHTPDMVRLAELSALSKAAQNTILIL